MQWDWGTMGMGEQWGAARYPVVEMWLSRITVFDSGLFQGANYDDYRSCTQCFISWRIATCTLTAMWPSVELINILTRQHQSPPLPLSFTHLSHIQFSSVQFNPLMDWVIGGDKRDNSVEIFSAGDCCTCSDLARDVHVSHIYIWRGIRFNECHFISWL